MKRSTRRVAVLAAAFLVGGLLTPATAAVASSAPAKQTPSAAAPSKTAHTTHGKASPGFTGKGTLRGVYRALTADVSNTPVEANPLFPPDISWTHDERRDVLEVNGKWVDVTLPKGHHAKPGQQLALDGVSDGSVFHASDIRSVSGTAASVDTTDVTKTLVILAEWNGRNGDTTTKAKASSVIFTQGNVFWKEVSYGLTSLSGTVIDWVHISGPSGGDCYGHGDDIMSQAKSKAAGIIGSSTVSSYERTIVYFPFCAAAGGAAGWAYVPGSSVWLNGYMDKRVSLHEQGHNYGLWHAHSIDCSTGAMTGSCSSSEYGDEYDTMGSGNWVGHYNAAEKLNLAWMSGRLKTYPDSGTATATLSPIETSAAGFKGGRINGSGSRSYWVEYRTAVGEDRSFPSGGLGIIVHMTNGPLGINDGGTNRLDVSRGADGYDGPSVALAKGASWTSPDGIRITFASVTTAGAQVTVTNGAPQPKVPGAPTAVTAKAGDTTALVNWAIPSDGGDALQGYYVYYQKSGQTALKKAVNSPGGTVHATTLTELSNDVTYTVWVRA
ncbi:MAG: hypothetical protein QOE64_1947, partial [Frankiales bacterium]|nr:hypothetical protein [Frankiales bacterium]